MFFAMQCDTELQNKFESEYEFISLEELCEAYVDCRRHKSSKNSCIMFEMNEASNLVRLWKELNNGTYKIGFSDTFVVTRPKNREVFAADFRDRIVHHLIIARTLHLFENYFIPDTYNCRKGKGTTYGVDRLNSVIKEMSNNYTEDCWILKCDIYSFFMSIDKRQLWGMLKEFLTDTYKGKDLDWVLWMVNMIVMHRPELKCVKKGNKKLFDELPPNKTLFKNGKFKGMAIGNLTSQIFVNFFLSLLDWLLTKMKKIRYGRYVDDFYIVGKDKRFLLNLMPVIRKFLARKYNLLLHPKKWYLQHYSKGITFTGTYLRYGKKFPGKNLMYNFSQLVKKGWDGNLEKFVQRMNSYLGFMKFHTAYRYRRRMYEMLPKEVTSRTYIDKDFTVLKIRNSYKKKTIIIKKLKDYNYGTDDLCERAVC